MKFYLTGIFGFFLLTGCLAPSGGPVPAAPLSPSTFNATPEGNSSNSSAEEVASPDDAATSTRTGGDTKAAPSWTSSSAAFIGCAAAEAMAKASLSDRSFMQPGNLGVTVEVRNPETGEKEPLAQHELTTTLLLRDPDGNVIEEGGDGSYKSLQVWVRIVSTYVSRTIVGATEPSGLTCDEIWEDLLQKRFVLAFSYRRDKTVYRGAPNEDIALLPSDQPPLLLDPVILSTRGR